MGARVTGMRDAILRAAGALLGGLIGYQAAVVIGAWAPAGLPGGIALYAGGVVVGGLAGVGAAVPLGRAFVRAMARVLHGLASLALHDLVLGGAGLLAGLVLALLAGYLLDDLPLIGPYVRLVAAVVFGYLGVHIAVQRRDEVAAFFPRHTAAAGADARAQSTPKLLDTSVIIDGRVAEVCRSGFLEGPLLVPRSVLSELQRIADSSDGLRRTRGRRGLDILNGLRRDLDVVRIIEDGIAGPDVDAQLVALAKARGAAIATTDFTLTKVAELQGVRVLNINDLAQALRPAVLPGEELSVHVVRDGKEAGQGVGYLEDGTMIVVEGGRRFIGETSDVVVTSVLQTSAGRMIFARPKSGEPAGPPTVPKR